MHWSVDVPTEAWRAWRAEYDRGRPSSPAYGGTPCGTSPASCSCPVRSPRRTPS
ncbi:hypothetical protein ACFQ3Z_16250 [Streptomyces nogalater]